VRICGVFGTLDESISPEAIDAFDAALTRATVEHEIYTFEAHHAFANPSRDVYDEKHANNAWKQVRKFLKKNMK
jgi:carboxymethylenebutenolidase